MIKFLLFNLGIGVLNIVIPNRKNKNLTKEEMYNTVKEELDDFEKLYFDMPSLRKFLELNNTNPIKAKIISFLIASIPIFNMLLLASKLASYFEGDK